MKIRLGTRESALALEQTYEVRKGLREIFPQADFKIVKISTYGDENLQLPISVIGGKGVFVKEVQSQLVEGLIDICVHSCKDIPAATRPEGVVLLPFWKEEDPRDLIVTKEPAQSIDDLPAGAVLGTGSQRRALELGRLRPDLKFKPIRGAVPTRVRKIEEEGLDGVVLAVAGLRRLGLEKELAGRLVYLDVDQVLPSPGQGIIALELREEDPLIQAIQGQIDRQVYYRFLSERAFLRAVGGDCTVPLGCWAQVDLIKEKVWLRGFLKEAAYARDEIRSSLGDCQESAAELVRRLRSG